MNQSDKENSLGKTLGVKISNLSMYDCGFSFTVQTELEAYKAAYRYQGPGIEKTVVREAPNVNAWSIHVYKKTNQDFGTIRKLVEIARQLETDSLVEFHNQIVNGIDLNKKADSSSKDIVYLSEYLTRLRKAYGAKVEQLNELRLEMHTTQKEIKEMQ